jgi:hypothetical protein
MTKNKLKTYIWEKFNFLKLSARTPKLQEKPSAPKREQPALKNIKFLPFFLFLCVIFALLDPDPDPATQINANPNPKPRKMFKLSC